MASVRGPRGYLGDLGRRGRDSRAGTAMVYLTALQKQPPLRVKGVAGKLAIEILTIDANDVCHSVYYRFS